MGSVCNFSTLSEVKWSSFRTTPLTPDEEQNGVFSHVILAPDTYENIEQIRTLYLSYKNDRQQNNYTVKRIDDMLSAREISIGVLVVLFNDQPVAMCTLNLHRGGKWVVINRYVRSQLPHLFFKAYGFCVIEQLCIERQYDGWFMTFNDENDGFFRMNFDKKRFHRLLARRAWAKYPLWKRVWDTDNFKILEHDIVYRHVQQKCVYFSLSGKVPQ